MMKDPVCGMEVSEEKAIHMIHAEHETFYFCSELCKESYARQIGIGKPPAKKGIFDRFLEKLAKENEKSFGGKPPTCH
jgi:YHS domain-containing protein